MSSKVGDVVESEATVSYTFLNALPSASSKAKATNEILEDVSTTPASV
jgi:hypothetical protein